MFGILADVAIIGMVCLCVNMCKGFFPREDTLCGINKSNY